MRQKKNQLGILKNPTKENQSLMVIMKEMVIIGQMKSLPGIGSHTRRNHRTMIATTKITINWMNLQRRMPTCQ
jgi:hypothetical protein